MKELNVQICPIESAPKATARRVLVAEDNAINRKVLRITLEAEGMSVVDADSGIEALSRLENESVDAIISDIVMPRMDGYPFCHELCQQLGKPPAYDLSRLADATRVPERPSGVVGSLAAQAI